MCIPVGVYKLFEKCQFPGMDGPIGPVGPQGAEGEAGSETNYCPCPEKMSFTARNGQKFSFPQGDMTHEQASTGFVDNKLEINRFYTFSFF